jgi:cytochrome c5
MNSTQHRSPGGAVARHRSRLALALGLVVPLAAAAAERTGEQVFAEACAKCHVTGEMNAPKIGDKAAWSKRAEQGLTALTEHALKGIRNMPAHGGNPGLSDFEIQKAITYLVNQSGGHWVEPTDKTRPAKIRTGEQIVKEKCVECHQTGKDGAPRIGDRDAWVSRVSRGFESVVASAIHGHGPMPPRGGMADLTDPEIRAAVTYMFQHSTAAPARTK